MWVDEAGDVCVWVDDAGDVCVRVNDAWYNVCGWGLLTG